MRALLVIVLISLPALLPAQSKDAAPRMEERGAELLQPFKQQLQSALKTGLKQSPAAAVDQCHLKAPGIPGQAAPEGVRLGRTSHKLRNPDNAPTDWQERMLEYYRDHDDRAPRARKLANGRVAYGEPITVKPMCTTCHGPRDEIPASVRAKLDEQYPGDEATGFQVGDFRGIFWATWPAGTSES